MNPNPRIATPEQLADTMATLLSLPVASTETGLMAYTLYFTQCEVVETLLDRYAALQPDYPRILALAVSEDVITRLQALIFSLEDIRFLRGLIVTPEEKDLYQRLRLLLHPGDGEFALGQY